MKHQNSKNVLVTGGAGYIGSHTCKALFKAGYLPITYDNLSVGREEAVKWGPLVVGDVGDASSVSAVLGEFQISSVIHFAASAYVGESIYNPKKYFNNNLANTLRLLDCILEQGVSTIVFSSTCATYGIPEKLPIDETHAQCPINAYAESKLAIEKILRWYQKPYGLRWVALRYFNAAGADPEGELGECHEDETHLIPLALRAATEPSCSFSIFGTDYPTTDGTAVRDFIHVADLASAHVSALRFLAEGGVSRAFNLGSGHGHSVTEVLNCVKAVTGSTVKVEFGCRRDGDPPCLIANSSAAREFLGWVPEHSALQEIISSAWRWMNRSEHVEGSARGTAPAIVTDLKGQHLNLISSF